MHSLKSNKRRYIMNLNQKEIKKRIKKRLSLILSLLLIISSVNISSANTKFADVPYTHWASKVIAKWSGEDYNVLQGDSKGNFNPSKGLTLGEFMTIISKTFGYVQKQETQVTPSWAKESVEKAIAAGILPKTEKIDANKMITRQEAIKYIAIAFGIESSQGNTPFIDDQDIDEQYKPYIKAFYDMGYITGDNKDKSKAKFNPKANYTRAEAMQVIDNILSDIIDRYTIDKTYEKNIIIRKAGVNLHNIKTKQNIIIAQGVQDSNISMDKVQIGKSLIIYGGKDISAISDKMIENTIINRPYKSVTLRGIFNTVTVHDKTTVHIIGKAEKIILLGSAKAKLNLEEVVQTKDDKNQTPSKSTNPTTKTPNSGGGEITQGSTGTIPSITVTTKFPTGTLSDSAIDIKYIATPSKGASIKEVTYTINDNFTEYLYYASENENERKGTLGQGRVLLLPGPNKIVFTVTDTAGKSGKYIVNQQPTFSEGTYRPRIKKSELSYLSDGSGRKFANNRIILNMKDNATKKDVDEIVEYVNGEIIGYLYIIGLVTIRVPENTEEGLKAMCRDIKNKYHNIVEYADVEIFEPIKFDSVDTLNNTDTKNNNPTIKKQDSVGAKIQGGTGTIPSITVTTKFPTETLSDSAIDIKYIATPSKGASIKEVTYTINDNFTEYLYYASENENERKGTLGQGRVLLLPGPNKIVFTVTDTAGKSGKYIVNQQPTFDEGTYTPDIKADELTPFPDGSGYKFANNRLSLDVKDGTTKEQIEEIARYVNGEVIEHLFTSGMVTIKVPKNSLEGLRSICSDIKKRYPNIIEYAEIERFGNIGFD
ncbi:MAG: S-layer homology domain-containing protein [Lachnospiraceae bacterium]|nr:MAG: S-layer homology domain-containing protein [Lachnospiraceae bacterium]